tara:strand:- start:67 stop:1719 length:1653 start_codon:yes stop_codon:yes gene_type:complete
MEYHNPHLNLSNCVNFKYGLLTKKYDKYFIDSEELENNRGIDGDIVYYIEDKVVAIKERKNILISGILHLNSNQKYGFTSKNVPYYKFTSLSNKYPSFIVPSKSKEKKALYCVIKLNKWETKNRNPIGQIEYMIGEVGNMENETTILLYKNNILPKKSKICYNNKSVSVSDLKVNIDYYTFSIDPKGCSDIDDALHFKKLDKNKYEIGIHIAHVARYVEDISTNFFSSVYLKDKQINMLSDKYSFDICSLGNGEPKYALSLILNYENNIIVSKKFIKTVIFNKAKSYNDVDNIIKNKIQGPIFDLYKFTRTLTNNFDLVSTKLVEYYMLLYNSLFAEILYKYSKNTILRVHKSVNFNNECKNISTGLNEYLNRINQNSAQYVTDPTITHHESLDLKYYTHATSPIRRYVDIINQMNMEKYFKKENINIENKIENINIFQKNLRKFYNNYKKVEYIFNMTPVELRAYIVDIDGLKIKIYIPEMDIEHNFLAISPKLVESNTVESTENYIIINQTRLDVMDSIKILITPLKYEEKFNNKLNVKLIEPEITFR